MSIQTRIQSLTTLLKKYNMDALVLNPGSTLTYLTGLIYHLFERPIVLVILQTGQAALILPEFEQGKAKQAGFPIKTYPYSENPATWENVFRAAVQDLGLDGKTIGVESTGLRFLELHLLEVGAKNAHFVAADDVISGLRIKKDGSEVNEIRKAIDIAQTALENSLKTFKTGITEQEFSAELTLQLLRGGSDSEFPFKPIIASGPNGANPHASVSDRKMVNGDLVIIDWGARYQSYISDLTRTFAVGYADPEFEKIASIVEKANSTARAAIYPGVTAGSVDKAARDVIEQSGYGVYFTHRTGHGIGMEGHEPPYIYGENNLVLEVGMAFTIEPGIYIPGRGGVRIEDNVVVTPDGAETLTSFPRPLKIIGG